MLWVAVGFEVQSPVELLELRVGQERRVGLDEVLKPLLYRLGPFAFGLRQDEGKPLVMSGDGVLRADVFPHYLGHLDQILIGFPRTQSLDLFR